jgi:hypothetical protein
MRRQRSIRVPGQEAESLREFLELFAAIKAETLERARQRAPDERAEAEAAITEVASLVEQLAAPAIPDRAVEITGEAHVLRDVLYGLLLDGADALTDACRAYESGEAPLAALRRAGEAAASRLALFLEFEEADALP